MLDRASRVGLAGLALTGAALASFGGCGLDSSGNPSDLPTPCKEPVDCTDTALCTIEGCSADSTCTHAPAPDGDAPLQIPGDCVRVTCKGGEDQPSPDGTDADDGNPCTKDSCAGGVAEHAELDDVVCMLGMTTGTCVAGECVVPCKASTMCDDGQPCTIDTCDLAKDGGTCTYDANHGALVSDLSESDCVSVVCNGKVAVTVAADDENPDDLNPCTLDACVGGVATYTPTEGSCGGMGTCNGSGQCVGCVGPDDCPGVDDACQNRTCTNRVCGTDYQPAGTSNGIDQTPGDCALVVCTGFGGTTSTADGSDTPPDEGNPCTSEACSGGAPSWPPMPVDTPCPGGVCNATGVCVECNSTSQCPAGNECNGTACANNACANPPLPAGPAPPGECPAEGPQSCGRDGNCDGGGECGYYALGTVCAAPSCYDGVQTGAMTCTGTYLCIGGGDTMLCSPYVCGATTCKTSCVSHGDCEAGHYCAGSACVPKLGDGTGCSTGAQCASESCVDGVCCDSACGGLCMSCLGSKTGGQNGTCASITSNSDPDNECQSPPNVVCCGAACGPTGC